MLLNAKDLDSMFIYTLIVFLKDMLFTTKDLDNIFIYKQNI